MLRVALGQLRHRLGRTLALLLGIAVAATSFSVLTGAVETTRVEVRGTVTGNFRSTYDLLVRPADSYTTLEAEQGLVRPNYQSGIFGGITVAQVDAIRAVTGVEVAAPVANLGYLDFGGSVQVPLEQYLNGDDQQLFRIRPTYSVDRGTSRFVGAPTHVYISRHRTTVLDGVPYTRGDPTYRQEKTYAEVVPGRPTPVPACTNYQVDKTATLAEERRADTPFGYRDLYATSGPVLDCYYTGLRLPANSLEAPLGAGDPAQLEGFISVPLPVLLTAIDPEAESALWGLDRAVTAGRLLTETDRVVTDSFDNPLIPVMAASSIDLDQQVTATVERVGPPAGKLLSDVLTGERGIVDGVAGLAGTPLGTVAPVTAARTYAKTLDRMAGKDYGYAVGNYWTVGPSTYDRTADGLAVRPVANPESAYDFGDFGGGSAPVGSDDSGVREVFGHGMPSDPQSFPGVGLVGRFDPSAVAGTGELSGLTAETYVSPLLAGADPASHAALGGEPLAPSTNLGGYAAQRPGLLTTLAGAAPLLDSEFYTGASAEAPISVVRVRVTGVSGPDDASRQRLQQVALAIAERTGLAVDIVAGASGIPVTVALPAGDHGRPELRLTENWARKGVAYVVVRAVDRKSVALFVLILTTCALVVGNAAAAAVRTRRVELGVLSGLGWGAGRLFGVVLLELAFVGLVAGVAGGLAALGLGAVFGLDIAVRQALLAVPVAVGLAALAGLAPAVRATRSTPVDAVRPVTWTPRRVRPVGSLTGMTVAGLGRTPGRTLLGAASLGIGVAATTVLLAVQQVFRGTVTGTLLGDAVTVQVRPPDVVALVAIALLAVFGVADVLYLAIREQSAELAVLQATGWTGGALSRLVLGQALGIGLLGSLLGALGGGAAVAAVAGSFAPDLLPSVAGAAALGMAAAALAAVVPAILVRRLPIAALVAEEA